MCLELISKITKVGATDLGLSMVEFMVLMCLISHGNNTLSNIYPSRKRISNLCAISVNHITKVLRSLELKGFLITKVSICGTKNNTYTILRVKIDLLCKPTIKFPKQEWGGQSQELGGQSQELGGAIPGITEQIMKQIINITTTSTMNNIDPKGSSSPPTPVVVVNKILEPEQENIRTQLTKWKVADIDDLISKHTVDQLNRAVRLTSSGSNINNYAAFFIKALKGGWINSDKTESEASEAKNIENTYELSPEQFKELSESKFRYFVSKYNFDKNPENLENIKNAYSATQLKHWNLLEKDLVNFYKATIIPEDPILVEQRRLEKEKAISEIKEIGRISPLSKGFAKLIGVS